MVSKILELSYYNMKFSLSSVIPVEKKADNTLPSDSESNFYDFSDIHSTNDYPNSFIIEGKNIEIAKKEISNILNTIDLLKQKNKIPNQINYSINNLVYVLKYNKQYIRQAEDSIIYKTFLKYTPLTKTGKPSKNMCAISFCINKTACNQLKNGIYMINNTSDGEGFKPLFGGINYNRNKEITSAYLDFSNNKKNYSIKIKNGNFNNIDDIELTIS